MDKRRVIVVLDDDPTGTQTVHDIDVYTDWEEDTLRSAVHSGKNMFFVLTNSRSFSHEKTVAVHESIGRTLQKLAVEADVELDVISRSDSTLRGHYPAETEALSRGLGGGFDGEVIMPFFPESGRYTKDNIHYVQQQDGALIPAEETEFAKDRTFGYRSSHMGRWVEEKTEGHYKAEDCIYIPINSDEGWILDQLLRARNFQKIIVNAMTYEDVQTFVGALRKAHAQGRRFLYRTAAAFPKVLGDVSDQALLDAETICGQNRECGGLIIIGSHVQKTTRQLEQLREAHPDFAYYEFDALRAMDPQHSEAVAKDAAEFASAHIAQGRTAVIYTSRTRIDLTDATGEEQLQASVRISNALTSVPTMLAQRPRYLISKGGITSSDIATQALKIRKALVLGQIFPGIPVWQTGSESLFPGLSYVIFPGNVGYDDTLKQIVSMLEEEQPQ